MHHRIFSMQVYAFWKLHWYCCPFTGVKSLKIPNFEDMSRHFSVKFTKYWNFHIIKTRNVLQSLAYSSLGITASPLASSNEKQMCCPLVDVDELTRVLIDTCCTQLQKYWIEAHQIFIWDVHIHCRFKCFHRHFNHLTRLEIVDRFLPNNHTKVHIYETLSQVTASKFTKFLHDVAASSPVLMPLCSRCYCITFQNTSAKTGGSQIQHLQKCPKLIGYHSNAP